MPQQNMLEDIRHMLIDLKTGHQDLQKDVAWLWDRIDQPTTSKIQTRPPGISSPNAACNNKYHHDGFYMETDHRVA